MDDKKIPIQVLLIEDKQDDVLQVTYLLEEAGQVNFVLHHANNLHEAEELLANRDIHVILMDLSMSDKHDLGPVKHLQHIDFTTPIVILTEEHDEKIALKALKYGVQDYLVKWVGDGHLIARSLRYAIERKNVEQHLSDLAHYDKLTGLANRDLFHERLRQALSRAQRNNHMVGLMFLDLDRFKEINDSLGHMAGDQLLIEVSKRLKHCTRETDTIARLGGDEFTVIVENIHSDDEAAAIAEKILLEMQAPFTLDGQEVFVTTSIGLTVYPTDAKDDLGLLKNADTAMYRAKAQGRNKYQYYSTEMNESSHLRLKMESQLRKALARNEFSLMYQPKVDMITGRIVGAEALLRWENEELGFVPPDEFIPIAEDTGLIIPIGEWVLRSACRQIRNWVGQGLPMVRIAVNLSARQFRQGNLAAMIGQILEDEDLTADCLPLEITESLLMADVEESKRALNDLKVMGLEIYLDDFGTGYSSLSYLKKFPIDGLKIDRSFVMDIPDDQDDMVLAQAIVAMSHALRLNVVAEGIETTKQMDFFKNLGCEEAQGYLFSRPINADDFRKLLASSPNFNEDQQTAIVI